MLVTIGMSLSEKYFLLYRFKVKEIEAVDNGTFICYCCCKKVGMWIK